MIAKLEDLFGKCIAEAFPVQAPEIGSWICRAQGKKNNMLEESSSKMTATITV